jgi:hypothetical protein
MIKNLGKILRIHTRDIYVKTYEKITVIEIHKCFNEKWSSPVKVEQNEHFYKIIVDNVPSEGCPLRSQNMVE